MGSFVHVNKHNILTFAKMVEGPGRLRLRYINFEHVQNLRSAFVAKNGRTSSVVRSWKKRGKILYGRTEVVVQAYTNYRLLFSKCSTFVLGTRHDVTTTILRP